MSDRKYGHRGYQDSDKRERKEKPKERSPEPRPRQDQLGPRTPRMVGSITRARCAHCGTVLVPGFDVNGQCPRCKAALHSCKQCLYFDTGARFECMQPIPERVPKKNAGNNCTFYVFRTTVEKDTAPSAPASSAAPTEGLRPDSARKAFDDLFKK